MLSANKFVCFFFSGIFSWSDPFGISTALVGPRDAAGLGPSRHNYYDWYPDYETRPWNTDSVEPVISNDPPQQRPSRNNYAAPLVTSHNYGNGNRRWNNNTRDANESSFQRRRPAPRRNHPAIVAPQRSSRDWTAASAVSNNTRDRFVPGPWRPVSRLFDLLPNDRRRL